jgi:hypothetical protein
MKNRETQKSNALINSNWVVDCKRQIIFVFSNPYNLKWHSVGARANRTVITSLQLREDEI